MDLHPREYVFFFFLSRTTCDTPVPLSRRPEPLPRSKHREITRTKKKQDRRGAHYIILSPPLPRHPGYRETFAKVPRTMDGLRKINNKKGSTRLRRVCTCRRCRYARRQRSTISKHAGAGAGKGSGREKKCDKPYPDRGTR